MCLFRLVIDIFRPLVYPQMLAMRWMRLSSSFPRSSKFALTNIKHLRPCVISCSIASTISFKYIDLLTFWSPLTVLCLLFIPQHQSPIWIKAAILFLWCPPDLIFPNICSSSGPLETYLASFYYLIFYSTVHLFMYNSLSHHKLRYEFHDFISKNSFLLCRRLLPDFHIKLGSPSY